MPCVGCDLQKLYDWHCTLSEIGSSELNTDRGFVSESSTQTRKRPMANNKNPNEKQPGEKAEGKYHYNPGNMSGKTGEKSEKETDQSPDELPNEHT
jgi:hypothetical protein